MATVNAREAMARLARARRVVEELGALPRKLAVIASPKITALIRKQFAAGTDPYGRPWKPLAASTLKSGRRPPPLTGPTKRLRDRTVARPMGGNRRGIIVRLGAAYGIYAQTSKRNRREIIPTRGMPSGWRIVLVDSARSLARAATGRART